MYPGSAEMSTPRCSMKRRAAVVRPSPQVLSRGNVALSTTRTSRPRRRADSAAAAPAGPAPTTRTSTADIGATVPPMSLLVAVASSGCAATVGNAAAVADPRSDRFDVGGLGGPESPPAFLGKQEWYEHRRLREADPRPGHPGRARPRDEDAEARGQADPRRLRRLRRRDGAPARRHRRGR